MNFAQNLLNPGYLLAVPGYIFFSNSFGETRLTTSLYNIYNGTTNAATGAGNALSGVGEALTAVQKVGETTNIIFSSVKDTVEVASNYNFLHICAFALTTYVCAKAAMEVLKVYVVYQRGMADLQKDSKKDVAGQRDFPIDGGRALNEQQYIQMKNLELTTAALQSLIKLQMRKEADTVPNNHWTQQPAKVNPVLPANSVAV